MPRLSKIGAAALAAFGWTSGGGGPAPVTASYLVISGGGAGGGGSLAYPTTFAGAGGGAGGLLTGTTTLDTTLSYTVIVGAGGVGAQTSGLSTNGASSSFNSIAPIGGGAGGGYGNPTGATGNSGGSGGGGGYSQTTGPSTGGAGTAGQGNNGGQGSNPGGNYTASGGGGGAGAVGGNASSGTGGAGGTGVSSSITGTSIFYAGGGGGGTENTSGSLGGSGGNGGGGAGATRGNGTSTYVPAAAGLANSGGGGGGSENSNQKAANGGSGVVIISYSGAQQFGGGVVTSVGGYTIHTFTTSGTLSPLSTLSASYLIVAGGGSGGGTTAAGNNPGGGGGAGGLITGSGATIDTNSTYLVTVGAGAAGTISRGVNGTNSSFSMVTTTVLGGGGGGSASSTSTYIDGLPGGSGGGGGSYLSAGAGGAGTSGQGNAGGAGNNATGPNYGGGGGGGASAVGGNGTGTTGGAGGAGTASSISGTSTYYAGGGGGATYGGGTAGSGGTGGGGAGAQNTGVGTAGTAGTGGGGGGSCLAGTGNQVGGAGGSGIVIISYAGSTQLMAGGTVTISGGNVIHTFTSSGYLAPLKLVPNSLRFRASASAALSRTVTTASSGTKGTFSAWVKRGKDWDSNNNGSIVAAADSYNYGQFYQQGLYFGNTTNWMNTAAVYRDPAAWYHVFFVFDTTQATSTNRLQIWVNGVRQTAGGVTSYPTQNASFPFLTSAQTWYIGGRINSNDLFYDGEITEVNFVDGQALTPNAFGTFNSYGVWQPITYGGSYGTNGFYLPFNAGTSTYAAGFNGSSQYVGLPTSSVFNFGTGDFTAECWFDTQTTSTYQVLIDFWPATSGSYITGQWQLGIDTNNWPYFVVATSSISAGNVTISTTKAAVQNSWNHVAVVRSGTTLTLYLNGTAVASTTFSGQVGYSSTTGSIGRQTTGSSYFNGYISNARITNTAVYTSNFTLPTANLTAVTGTQLLTLQNATVVDNSTNALTLTNNTGGTGLTYPFSAAKIFNDQGPAGNNWTINGAAGGGAYGSTLDYMTDVPTLTSSTAATYATLNPAIRQFNSSDFMSDGNLKQTIGNGSGVTGPAYATIPMPSGKWYAEVYINAAVSSQWVGVSSNLAVAGLGAFGGGVRNPGYAYKVNTGNKCNNDNNGTAYAVSSTTGDTIGIAMDADSGSITFYKNGTSLGVAFTGMTNAGGGWLFGSDSDPGGSFFWNFGQQPFKYTPPSGFVALNTYNL